ncbi:hypothetical protein MKX79_11945 [Viridibacillus sp. FSL R5-0468]|uniref:hypothetical protein n=1 Tax=Viridibacillus sp. FSL R5-0468 TaxID=2921640 RepID=UPI0030FB4EF3
MSNFIHFKGILTELHETSSHFALTCQKQDDNSTFILNITKETLIFNSTSYEPLLVSELKRGFFIHAYVHELQPAMMIFPPQFSPTLVLVNEKDLFYGNKVGTYNAETSLVEADLRLNISQNTKIIDAVGESIATEKLDGHDIAVFFKMSTRSIPPQTTPQKIILLDD